MAMNAHINKATLKAICDNSGVQSAYLAQAINCTPASKVDEWMDLRSHKLPTFNQAKMIAKKLKIPFAGLYMNPDDIPKQKIPKVTNRRAFPKDYVCDDSAVNLAIIELLNAHDLTLTSKAEINERVPIFNISFNLEDDPIKWASKIRNVFGISLDEQYKCKSARQFYLFVRNQIEEAGIFIHCYTGVDIESARGLAIYDDIMPIIGINNEDRYPAKTFTIFHELTHILKRQSSLCNEFFNNFTQQQEEVFCNAVAGEVLVPYDALSVKLKNRNLNHNFTVKDIDDLANDFSISKEVITRRLLDTGHIGESIYHTFIDEFRRMYESEKAANKLARKEGRAPNIYPVPSREAFDKTSTTLSVALFKGYNNDIFTKQDISRYLGIGQRHIVKFLQEVSKWSN